MVVFWLWKWGKEAGGSRLEGVCASLRFESKFFGFDPLLSTEISGQREEEWVLVFGWQGMGVMEGWSGGHWVWE